MSEARFILVHGAWGSSASWGGLPALLRAQGHSVRALDLPGHGEDRTPPETVTLADYARHVAGVLRAGPPAVLVGHSMGGMVISAAAETAPEHLERLVYLAAFLPKSGDSLMSLKQREGPTIAAAVRPGPVRGTTVLDPDTAAGFLFQDATPEQRASALSRLGPQPNAPQVERINLSANRFGQVPRHYILCENDQTVTPELQRAMATETPCETLHSLPTGHLPQLTAPQALADLLNRIVSEAK
ncbi:pimeloyl-ACP methyl ester carboxylesterase [Rhodovulum imhoffii]|uniref:Pimeloyl-ACP methyl ester carboxylesterase n=1 Tax=Rhodovulum imhoffii TaxID=365340 RepID=A0A2T5BRB0_9RHOB|nr:alpha/beta hydrolase [Rhodovulum imhoffii]MBK5934441.1 hypothetical protein [Rhodovulum imhoffii]PTN01788.1 pimeloyl-ACP methyl ester carboxylesterase [Rhodovulum imhoffii]